MVFHRNSKLALLALLTIVMILCVTLTLPWGMHSILYHVTYGVFLIAFLFLTITEPRPGRVSCIRRPDHGMVLWQFVNLLLALVAALWSVAPLTLVDARPQVLVHREREHARVRLCVVGGPRRRS